MYKVSVIIPNYNGFKHSKRCLDALERQTHKNFEVCIVDDASTDDSYDRFLEYAEKASFPLKVIKIYENKGPGNARAVGIDNTNSEWIAFCDIDDWYDVDYLERQIENAELNNADLAICDNNLVFEDGRRIKSGTNDWAGTIPISKGSILANSKMSLCRLVAKRELFKDIEIPTIYYGEDAPVTVQLIKNANAVFVDCEARYNYHVRKGSASVSLKKRAIQDYLVAYEIIKGALNDAYKDECIYIGINIILYGATLILFKQRASRRRITSIINEFECMYPNWNKNKYLKNLEVRKKLYLKAIKRRNITWCKLYARIHETLLTR